MKSEKLIRSDQEGSKMFKSKEANLMIMVTQILNWGLNGFLNCL